MANGNNVHLNRDDAPVLALGAFLPYQLVTLAEAVSRSFSRIYADRFGISVPEWRVMAIVGERHSVTAKDIVVASSMHKTKVSRAVAALESKGYIKRIANENDLREQLLELSETGVDTYQRLVPEALAFSETLRDALTGDQEAALEDIFNRLTAAADRFRPGDTKR